MKVPVSTRNIPLETPTTRPVSMPSISTPGVVPGAFGVGVGKAYEGLGEGLKILAAHAERMVIDEQDKEVLRRETAFMQDWQDRLTNQEDETKEVNGQEVTRKKGLLLRSLGQAKDVTLEAKLTQQKIREEYLKSLTKYQSDKLAPFMDKHFLSIESRLVTHEQNQLDEEIKTTVEANINEKINNYSMLVKTPEQMQTAITDVLSSNQVYNRRFSPAVQDMNNRKLKDDLVSEVAKWNIYNDPSTQEEKSIVLANLKDTKGMYKDLTQSERIKLVKESQGRIFQNNQTLKRENEVSKDTRFNNIFDKMNNGSLTLRDIDNEMAIPEEGGGIPKKQLLDIKEGIQKKVESDLDLIINKNDKANNYLNFINTFIEDETDRQKAREYLAKAFKDNILSSQEASFLNKIKRETEDVEFNRTGMWLKSAINKIREVFRGRKTSTDSDAALAIKQLINGVSKGKNPADVVKEIVYQSAIKKNPDLLNIPEGGELRMDAEGNIKIVAPDLNTRDAGEGK